MKWIIQKKTPSDVIIKLKSFTKKPYEKPEIVHTAKIESLASSWRY
ncbi:hypothetical protein JXJ21_14155 [candidate division KSB1 bacterium]|nr:hypothetical protein [candidate division KSB1 bacterium]